MTASRGVASPFERLDDAALGDALRDLGRALAVPTPGPALPARVRGLVESTPQASPSLLPPWAPARWRRSAVLALAALLVLAAVASAAIGFALPGLRILFGPPPSVVPPTPSASLPRLPGSGIGLGAAVSLDEARSLVDFAVVLPTEPDLGPPDVVYARLGRLALVWAPRSDLPATLDPTVGLLLSEFAGRIDEGLVHKLAGAETRVEAVTVGGEAGYWIDGAPHFFWYLDPDGAQIDDSYRAVGDTLVWTVGGVTYRLETSLGREAAIRIAESLR